MPRLLPLLLAGLMASGCGDARRPARQPMATPTATSPPGPEIAKARCSSHLANCAAATGRIIYLERIDADGDGDLHLVILGGGVTGPGITVLDIEKGLRPRRDPRVGDLVSAAGPVYRGSYGQRQIQATVLHIQRR